MTQYFYEFVTAAGTQSWGGWAWGTEPSVVLSDIGNRFPGVSGRVSVRVAGQRRKGAIFEARV